VDDNSEDSEVQFRPSTENETDLRQRRRSSASNRSGSRQRGGIRKVARDFWTE